MLCISLQYLVIIIMGKPLFKKYGTAFVPFSQDDCCGVAGYTDWETYNTSWYQNRMDSRYLAPPSCCVHDNQNRNCSASPENIFRTVSNYSRSVPPLPLTLVSLIQFHDFLKRPFKINDVLNLLIRTIVIFRPLTMNYIIVHGI